MADEQVLKLLAYNRARGAGPHADAGSIYRKYGTRSGGGLFRRARLSFDSDPRANPILPAEVTERKYSNKEMTWAHEEWERVRAREIALTTWLDPHYPSPVREIESPPLIFYVKGDLEARDRAAVAIVGSRRASPHYVEFAGDLGYALARRGVTVVSGFARGIDRAAHEGAIRAKGRTLAVLGTGIDVGYPRGHETLSHSIAKYGAVLSYYPLGTPPQPHHFPARNWVIAGLALVVVVVQCAQRSGALITAHYGAALGRDVMAVPGLVGSALYKGTNELIKDGAGVVTSVDDVLECLEQEIASRGITLDPPKSTGARSNTLEDRIAQRLGEEPCDIEALVRDLSEGPRAVQQGVVRLEMDGRLTRLPDGRYRLRPLK